MKKILLIAAIVLTASTIFAQPPAGMQNRPGGGQGAPSIGHIYGRIVDSAGHAVSQASVVILQSKKDTTGKQGKATLLKGLNAGTNGDFSFEELPLFTNLILKISAVGFKELQQTEIVLPGSSDKDLGNIKLSGDCKYVERCNSNGNFKLT